MLKRYILERWTDFTGRPVPESVDLSLITSCRQDYGNDLFLLFIDGESHPSYVIKICRDQLYGFKLKREYWALTTLGKYKNTRGYIPKAFYIGKYKNRVFFIQGGLRGPSLSKLLRKNGINRRNKKLIEQSITLLVDFNSISINKEETEQSSVDEGYELKKHKNLFIEEGFSQTDIKNLTEFEDKLSDGFPVILTHGDFWQSNIIVSENHKNIEGVIDWEFVSCKSHVPFDIIKFLINSIHCFRICENPRANLIESYKWGFWEKGEHTKFMTAVYLEYMSRMGLDADPFNYYLKLTLARLAVRERVHYGRHADMDKVWMEMLHYTMSEGNRINFG